MNLKHPETHVCNHILAQPLSIASSWVETLFCPSSFYTMLASRYFESSRHAKRTNCKFKGGPKFQWGPIMLTILDPIGPHPNRTPQNFMTLWIQGCRQGGGWGGWSPPPDFNSCYFTAKERWKQERKKQLSGYKHAVYIQNWSSKVSKYTNSAVITCNKLIGYTARRRLSVLFLWTCSIVQSNLLCCCT